MSSEARNAGEPYDAGRLAGIARRPGVRARMEVVDAVAITAGGGLEGDHKGLRFPRRGVTLIEQEAWEAAIAELADLAGPVPLPWTARRANLLTEGVHLPQARGALLAIGPVRLEVTDVTWPCRRMDEVHPGLLKALARAGRGGVTARVLEGGTITRGMAVDVLSRPVERRPRLP